MGSGRHGSDGTFPGMTTSPRSLLVVLLLAVLVAPRLSGQTDAPDRPSSRPNVLLIVADDLGAHDLSWDDPEHAYRTPHLDRLAREGTRFLRAYATAPVCSPSRYSLMTGRYPIRAHVTEWFSGRRAGRYRPARSGDRMPLSEKTVAEYLRDAGYRTFFAGKWHLGPDAEHWPEAHGFEVNRGGWKSGGPYGGRKYFSPYGNPRLEDGPDGEHLPARLAEETARFVEAEDARPFLAVLSFYSVHTPLIGREDLVEAARARLPARSDDDFVAEEQVWPTDRPRRARVVRNHAIYAAMVEAMDEAVGKLLERLERSGRARDTLVIFTSDHGGLSTSEGSPTSNEPLRTGKGWLYEGGLRVPLSIRWPARIRGGTPTSEPVTGADLLPTILEACGVPLGEPAIDGRSLLGHLEERKPNTDPRPLHWHYPHYANQGGFPGAVLMVGNEKLILRYEDGRHHLYDLGADPGERRDLAPERAERASAMRAQLIAWLAKHEARFLRRRGDGPEPWRPQ